ncbi:nitrilase-related carbon-nitrogen hydrolase [Streptomyces nanshensis]|uniref:Amidohydrolase n=1 Tax=Streptomyces nanshensis TaxID=518642 RepID=A0A1E7L8U0_9ACTN|nr:nitrilase-related carbon-nitrogen hydrolase [Streptomyces nanshensis]OEV12584.1 amidohydrolase [Streptomyces nanshensis]
MARIAVAQVDCTLGEVEANVKAALEQIRAAAAAGADVVAFPELALHGYALGRIEDSDPLRADAPQLTQLAGLGPDVLMGFHEDGGIRRFNSAAYLTPNGPLHVHRKLSLPTYLAWEELKHASPGDSLRAVDTRIGRIATLICNDAWQPALPWLAAQDGAEVLLVPANSAQGMGPDALDLITIWRDLLRFIACMQQCWVIFCNRVGTEAGARFWGGSCVLAPGGELVAEASLWEPGLIVADIEVSAARRSRFQVPLLADARLELIEREVARLIRERAGA